jgi:hypothetical protein
MYDEYTHEAFSILLIVKLLFIHIITAEIVLKFWL